MVGFETPAVKPGISFSNTSGGVPVGVPPDAARLLGAIFAQTDVVHVRLVETWAGPDGKKLSRIVPHGSRWFPAGHYAKNGDAWRPLTGLSAREHGNVFFGVCPRFGTLGNYEDAWQIRTVRVLWADLDHCTAEEARQRCEGAGLPRPSIIVGSGNGVHLYWILDVPFCVDDAGAPQHTFTEWNEGDDGKKHPRKYIVGKDHSRIYKGQAGWPKPSGKAEKLKRILAGVAKAIGGDHTIDLARLMRLPGTMNRKNGRNGAEPRPCVLVECEEGRRYPLSVFESFEAKEPTPTPTPPTAAGRPADLSASVHVGAARLGLSDLDLLDKARFNGVFDAFWRGDRQDLNPSQADYRLCFRLAFWTNRDAARTASLFRQSGLFRPAPEKSADYPELTARNACREQTRGYGDGNYVCWADELEKAVIARVNAMEVDDFTPRLSALDRLLSAADDADDARAERLQRLIPAPTQEQLAEREARQKAADDAKPAAADAVQEIEEHVKRAWRLRPRREARCGVAGDKSYFDEWNPRESFRARRACGMVCRCEHCRTRVRSRLQRDAAVVLLHDVPEDGLPKDDGSKREPPPLRIDPVYYYKADAKSRWAVRKRIRDAAIKAKMTKKVVNGKGPVRIKVTAGTVRIVSDDGAGDHFFTQFAVAGFTAVSPAEAAKRAARLIRDAKNVKRPVAFSGRWKRPETVKRWQQFVSDLSKEEQIEKLCDAGAEVREFCQHGGGDDDGDGREVYTSLIDGFTAELPETMTTVAVYRLYAGFENGNTTGRPTLIPRRGEQAPWRLEDELALYGIDPRAVTITEDFALHRPQAPPCPTSFEEDLQFASADRC